MQQAVNPKVMGLILAIVIIVAGVFLFKSASSKPDYPGVNVGPGGGPGMTEADGKRMKEQMGGKK